MASYLRPRRGKKSTAESQALVLKRGEVFFECPDTGVGTGAGKIKVGDGSTAYSSLPYFLQQTNVENSTIGFTDTSSATDSSNNPTYLTNIKPANSLKTIFTNLKQLLYNYNSQLTSLNNDKFQFEKVDAGTNSSILDENINENVIRILAYNGNNCYITFRAYWTYIQFKITPSTVQLRFKYGNSSAWSEFKNIIN